MFKLKMLVYGLGMTLHLVHPRIGIVDFYGYGSLDVAQLRAALPFREGGAVPSDRQVAAAREALKKVSGRPDAAVELVCCLDRGRYTVYVGLAEPGVPTGLYNPRPTADVRLPAEVASIFKRMDGELFAAVRKNQAQEDDSAGYALVQYPPLRADQGRLRDWARAHPEVIYHVLDRSRYDQERANAAEALGYAERSPQQIRALVLASDDPNEEVRNNAVRALAVLCNVGREVAQEIPAGQFIELLHSLRWTDRNKSLMLLEALSKERDRELLERLHRDALGELQEMARWKDEGHRIPAAIIVGRIAGIEEQRLMELVGSGRVEEILNAVR